MPQTPFQSLNVRRAFTLVEVLVVVVIIAVLISILVPALGGAQNAARGLTSQNMMTGILQASQQFQLDNGGRFPGFYSPAELGSEENGGAAGAFDGSAMGAGMSAMENILLDLSGSSAIVDLSATPFDPRIHAWVGPVEMATEAEGAVAILPDLIGAGDDAYITLSADFLVPQVGGISFGSRKQWGTVAMMSNASGSGAPQMPDVVDSFGQPLLAWVADTAAVPQITTANGQAPTTNFAAYSSGPNVNVTAGAGPALFYWNSNAAFLRAQAVGRADIPVSQSPENGRDGVSLIGAGTMNIINGISQGGAINDYFTTFFGATASVSQASLLNTGANVSPYPTRPIGQFILQSAGRDLTYFSAADPRASQISSTPIPWGNANGRPGIQFGNLFSAVNTDEDPLTISDIFDDILITD
ncbi:MAG: prepilin-type N-terminal cleavage/methylation domain-containing protein [Planctomycetota bacterium]